MVFLMIDSQGRQGGSSDILTVASSDDSTCLSAQSPTSTASPSQSGTSTPVVTETAGSKISVGAIAGTALGALIALVRKLFLSALSYLTPEVILGCSGHSWIVFPQEMER